MMLRLVASTLTRALRASRQISCNETRARHLSNCCAYSLKQLRTTGILFYSSESPGKCWQCDYPFKSEFFCQKCKTVQELPSKLNYFQIIGIAERYDLDAKELQRKYRELQNLLHPDRFSNKTEKEQEISASVSSMINKAYETLADPLERGVYMLNLKGYFIPEDTKNLKLNFLLDVMEKHERVEKASKDIDRIMNLMAENEAALDEYAAQVSEAFRANDLERAQLILVEMKYYGNLQTRLKQFKRELGVVD